MVGNCCEFKEATTSLENQNNIVRLSVPIHGNQPLKRGLLHHLLKMADIDPGAQQ
jgi:hypothetical protein